MKIALVFLLCSSVNVGCLDPMPYPEKFEDEYTCLLKGYDESKRYGETLCINFHKKDY